MRLVELVGPEAISLADRPAQRTLKQPRKGILGVGLEASAYDHPTHPGAILKYVNIKEDDPNENAQVSFVHLALENKDNPFFPRIYRAKVIPLKDNPRGLPYQMVIEMEKLYPLFGNKIRDVLPHILENLGIKPKHIANLMKKGMTDPNVDMEKWHKTKKGTGLFYAFVDMMDNWDTLEKMAQMTKIPELTDAINKLQNWQHNYGLSTDLHHGNFMFRLTSVGPQLVFTDPFLPSTF